MGITSMLLERGTLARPSRGEREGGREGGQEEGVSGKEGSRGRREARKEGHKDDKGGKDIPDIQTRTAEPTSPCFMAF